MTTILGIETSCDETAAAVVVDGRQVLSNVVASQVDLHAKYGGVVPEIASRAHIERMNSVIREALEMAAATEPRSHEATKGKDEATKRRSDEATKGEEAAPLGPEDIDCIAVTYRPGLIGSLLIGVTAAKTLAWAWGRPLVAVDHILAHATSAAIDVDPPPWPAVALIVSGGHTILFHVRDFLDIERLGSTTDDAAGEAFDKVATVLGLPYPGGPQIDKLARTGDPQAVAFPRTLLGPDSLDFSFSGIKTAVMYHVHGAGKTTGGLDRWTPQQLADIAASFQQSVIDVLITKTMRAVDRTGVGAVVMGGGVAANSALRTQLAEACARRGLSFHAAKMSYCMDNAAMIASLGYHLHRAGHHAGLDLAATAC